jgi:hypothetical protein
MTPTLSHTLKNYVKGWSGFFVNQLDIRKIIKIDYHKRLFCVFDHEYKYTLEILYYNPRSESRLSPVITSGGHMGISFNNDYEETSTITVRYKSENEVKQEISEIKKMQYMIKKFDEEQNKKLVDFINKNQNFM